MTEQKYTYKKWKAFVSLSYEDKLMWSRQLIASTLKLNKKPVVCLSWGKDSIVMLHLIRQYCKNTYVVFANTLIEYPETYKYRDMMLKEHLTDLNYFETKPIKQFGECIKLYGYPHKRMTAEDNTSKRQPKCCIYLKERPLDNKIKELGCDVEFIGLQTTESMNRRRLFMRMGAYYPNKARKINVCLPLAIWNDKDIKRYAQENKIPLNPLYKIMNRTGCMFCTGFLNWREVMAKYNKELYAGILLRKEGQEILRDCYNEEEVMVDKDAFLPVQAI